MEKAIIKTGVKEIELCDEKGRQVAILRIRPTDLNMKGRLDKAGENINKAINDAESNPDLDTLSEVDKVIKENINFIFGYDISKDVFKEQSCLSPIDGKTFAERFLEVITPVVKSVLLEEKRKSEERITRYTKDKKGGRRR